jgi:hypothetical protein
MRARFWKRAASAWIICGIVTWAYADVVVDAQTSLEVKLVRLPLRLVTWPIRIYGLATTAEGRQIGPADRFEWPTR